MDQATLRYSPQVFLRGDPEDFYNHSRYLYFAQAWARAMTNTQFHRTTLEPAFHSGNMPEHIVRHATLILQRRPSIVGISVCYTQQYWYAMCLAKEIARRSDVPIVMGGSSFNDVVSPELISGPRVADYVVVGAGEIPLVEILKGQADSEQIAGVVRIRNGKATACPAVYDLDLDSLGQPDFSDLDLVRYYSPEPILPILTSRGCYWHKCAFCNHFKGSGEIYQRRSISAVIDELRTHVSAGVRNFYLADSVVSPSRFGKLADAILESGLSIRYYAMARMEKAFDRDLLCRIYRSGCKFILWGLESGNQRVLNIMNKGTTVDDAERILSLAAEVGLRNHVFTICGFPTETEDEYDDTLDLLRRNKKHIAVVHRCVFTLEASSPVQLNPQRFSITQMWRKTTPHIFDFACSTGMDRTRAQEVFVAARPFLRSFSGDPSLGGDFKFREHCLLHYSHADSQ
ncbi:MAG: B12-binding domain-containing radical SAM protein [Polyangiaceae bacterium]|nr:B12-binding domain-containing radical SAM protein [Polyangiaceae bacterium]